MPDLLEPLRRLQTIDGELYRLKQAQRQKPLELERAKQQVAEEQAVSQAVEERLKALQLRHKEKELELSTRETNIKKLQTQLFQVKTNKEYSAIQHEIDQSKADISQLEEEILALLEGIDQAKREQAAAQGTLTQTQQQLRQEQTRIDGELAAIREQMTALEQQRHGVAPSVQREALSLYERILTSREGLAVVPLRRESCGGCHMVQPPQVVSEVQLNAKLVTCESCSRILYLDDSE